MNRFLALGLGCALTALSARAANFQTFSVPGYPAGQASCQAEADALGARIAAGGVTVYQSHCDRDNQTTFDLSVTYVADAPLAIESTYSADLADIDSQGTYATADACQADLPRVISSFQAATGLNPVVSYCYYDQGIDSRLTELARVEALGTGKEHAFSDNLTVDSMPTEDTAELAGRLQSALSALYPIESLVIDSSGAGSYRLGLHYFATSRLPVTITDLAVYRDRDLCDSQVAAVQQLFTANTVQGIGAFCTISAYSEDVPLSIVTVDNQHAVGLETAPDTYTTFDACDADRARIVAYYVNTLGKPAFGAVCEGSNQRYSARVLLTQAPLVPPR